MEYDPILSERLAAAPKAPGRRGRRLCIGAGLGVAALAACAGLANRGWVRGVAPAAAETFVEGLWDQAYSDYYVQQLNVTDKVVIEALANSFRKYNQSDPRNLPMPDFAEQYNGMQDTREFNIVQDDLTVFFIIGDWGARLPDHHTQLCIRRHTVCDAQLKVALAMRKRAERVRPQYVLNAGDNQYFAGVEVDCNEPPSAAFGKCTMEMASIWQGVYGDQLTNVPWVSTMGNHDYGGYLFNSGWPQYIGYSFVNHNWIMPARWYNRLVQHKGYDVEIFVHDSNHYVAWHPRHNEHHNICAEGTNKPGAHCRANHGAEDVWDCPHWFERTYNESKRWMEKKIANSTAHWKIVLTHQPCEADSDWYRGLHEAYGLDLLVTGHRHQQELWGPWPKDFSTDPIIKRHIDSNNIGRLTCVVSGGGGGIGAENYPGTHYGQHALNYGFFEVAITKFWMNIQLVGAHNQVTSNITIFPSGKLR